MTQSDSKVFVSGLNGFVGSNTTEALVELGIDCVVTEHKSTEVPGTIPGFKVNLPLER